MIALRGGARGEFRRGGAEVWYSEWPGRVVMAGLQSGRGGAIAGDSGGVRLAARAAIEAFCSRTPMWGEGEAIVAIDRRVQPFCAHGLPPLHAPGREWLDDFYHLAHLPICR